MANPGGVGAKFVSVNLNKSYGQSSHHNYQPYSSGSYGPAGSRVRPGSHASAGAGGGGGMVVLSRNRPLQKAAPKLSVPPPLNLPSLRKEHEKHDLSGAAGGSAGASGTGSGPRPTSSGMGWTKPGNVALQEKEGGDDNVVAEIVHDTDGVSKGGSTYMPPSARLGGGGLGHTIAASAHSYPPAVEKAMVLRGEDFPSLRAALPTPSGPIQKQKDISSQKQKQLVIEESSVEQRDSLCMSSPVRMRPQGQSSHVITNGLSEKGGQSHRYGGAEIGDQSRKQEIPLPLVRLNPRSDWADDERDTGHVFADRSRDHGFPKSEPYWERDFDMPRSSILPHKPPRNTFERWGQHSDEAGKSSSNEVPKLDPYHRDASTPYREDREGNTWRNSSLHKDGLTVQEVVNDRNDIGRPAGLGRDALKDNKYTSPSFGDKARHGVVSGNWDFSYGRRDMGHGQHVVQQWNQPVESLSSRGAERHARDRYGVEQSSRYRGDASQNSTASKSSFSSGGKGLPMNDPLLNFGREKRAFPKNERSYVEDPYSKDFSANSYDETDPFSASLVGLVKRKKDVVKPTDFHDPVRESFEAELERVQKMQEMERQRVIEEQERALEQARREEEERRRLIREEEERQRRLEDEAREAAWRAEQQRLDAIRKAEEQRIAREEEKKRIYYEEERRKHAAKQKLLELEAKIAQRQTEVAKNDSFTNTVADDEGPAKRMEKDISTATDLDNWEDSERMVERITTSASSDSSTLNRSSFVDRGKPGSPWRRDAFENGNNPSFLPHEQENGHSSPRRDAFGGRAFPRREFYGGGGYMPSRTDFKGGMQEPQPDGFAHHLREHRWNQSGDADHYNKNRGIESEFYENIAEKYADFGWGQGHSRSNTRPPYSERLYSESDEIYSYGRSRYSMRQPRVLPPPTLTSVHRTSFRGENEHSVPSTSLENDGLYNHLASRAEPSLQTGYYGGCEEDLEPPERVDVRQEIATQRLDNNATPRCDSQSSLSVSSPPSSPTHLSHDDEMDDSAGSLVVSTAVEGKGTLLSGNNSDVLNDKSEKEITMKASNSISADDDDEWSLENDEEMQEQEEYDEDDDGYEEEDEVHERDDENIDLMPEFEHMHLERKGSSDMIENLVLGFDEGVEVGIPSDEFERNLKSEANKFDVPEISVGISGEEQKSVDGVQDDECLQQMFLESEKGIQNSATQPLDTSHTSTASDLLDNVDASSGSGLSAQCTVPALVDMASQSSSQAIMPAVSSAPSQADLPVKLQFGLFSGPSLIPSPVPAIQIGSIQMPLHLHPQVGPSISHIHPSQPPLFQFGQLRYSSPVSQGILPMAPQSMSFVQPTIHTHYNLNQNSGSTVPSQSAQDASTLNLKKDDVPSLLVNNQPAVVSAVPDLSHENWSRGLSSFHVRGSAESNPLIHNSQTQVSSAIGNRVTSKPGLQGELKGHHDSAVKTYIPSSGGRLHNAPVTSQSVYGEKDFTSSKAPGPLPGNKGRKIAYPARNSGMRSSFPASEASRTDSSGGYQRRPRRAIQRTEFRVRENVDRRQTPGFVSSNQVGPDKKSNSNGKGVGTFTRGGFRRGSLPIKPSKQIVESESMITGPNSSQEVYSESRTGRGTARQSNAKSLGISYSGEGNLKRNISEEDVDAPLQSGIVRVFKQPGIEGPSDEDDFIEVRSKRQMLNDRREQREKEIKAKSRVTKLPRKPRSSVQSTVVSTSSTEISTSLRGQTSNNICSDFVSSEGRGIVNKESSAGFPTMVSQPLAPIGTPAVNIDTQADIRSHTIKSLQTVSAPVISGGGKDLGPSLIFESKNKVLDNVQASVGAWGAQIDQQVMALTQTQLDEAMKPGRFDTHVTSIGDHTSSVGEPILSSSSILTKEKSISSSASPINSLLAGEKIQFGAVTSPTVLPPSSRIVSHAIGAPGSFRSDIKISQCLSKAENDCTLFFEKDKHANESCALLEDCEAEAEAAASAVAVAAISTDVIVGNRLGSVSVSDTKSFGGADVDGIAGGVAVDQQSGSQSRAEESLSVSLPADLSVETPPISLWPPLPSPQNSSAPMLSHFPGAPPSHFPFYEMNHPMMRGPIFAFGPHEESGASQSQSQKSTVSGSGHIGAWQHHSSVDSFYGPPAGFSGPFISPPGGIPGVQAPPHMVVYNHYAPVGQFGQVGLSFMGATYIPSGKQPDWKHNPTSSAMGIGEGDMNAMNMVSAQRNPPNMPPPLQHLAPGSPLLPMASPLAMFDVSPFQTAPDISVQARWPHVPASALHSVPMSLPLQQQTEGAMPSQFSSHVHPVDQSLIANRFSESRTSTPSDNGRAFAIAREANVTQFPDELGLVESSSSTISGTSTQLATSQGSSGNTIVNAGKTDGIPKGSSNNGSNGQAANAFKPQHPHPKNLPAQHQQYSQSTGGYGYQRGTSQKNNSVGEWSHRRMGFHGRNQSLGADRSFSSSKMKQIYVAKQTSSGPSSTVE